MTEDAARLIAEIAKLCRHIEGLQRDVNRLAGRIAPFEDEESRPPAGRPWAPYATLTLEERKNPSLALLTVIVRQADHQLKDAEMEINRIGGQLDQISNDAYLQADLKQWLDEGQKERKR